MRTLAAALGVTGILGLVSLPPEHVHLIAEHGEHTEVVHRHLAPHHHADAASSVDHDDGDAQYLDSSFTIPSTPQLASPAWMVPAGVVAAALQPQRRWFLPPIFERVHDPPWLSSSGLRGPPSLPV